MPSITKTRGEETGISALSQATGVNIETIRFYEKQGLVPLPPRTEGGHRVYGPDHRRRLIFIRRSRELGFSLDEIRALLDLVDGGRTCDEVRAVTLPHLRAVREKIADLQRLERTLSDIAGRCEGGTAPECPILDALLAPSKSWAPNAYGNRGSQSP